MPLQKPKPVRVASSSTLRQVRSSSSWWWYSRVTECGTGRLLHGLVKQTYFCLSFISLWPQNGSFQTPQICQSLFRSSTMVMNLGYNKWTSAISSTSSRHRICAKSSRCDISRQSAQLWNS